MSFFQFLRAALFAPGFVTTLGIAIGPEMDNDPAFGALGRLKGRRIRQLLKIVFVGPIPDVHFGLKRVAAWFTILPVSGMPLVVVGGTERIAAVIPVAAITGVRKHHVLVLVIADPVPAAFGPDQLTRLAAQAATRLVHSACQFALRHFPRSVIVECKRQRARRLFAASLLSRLGQNFHFVE